MVEGINETLKDSGLDLAIIGGGIIGMCAAWHAAQQFPQWRIAVFEQNKVGSGASHYSASLDLPYGHTALRFQLASRSNELYTVLRKALPLPIKDLPFYGIATSKNSEKILQNFVNRILQVSLKEINEIAIKYPGLIIPDGQTVIAKGMANYATKNDIVKIIGENFITKQHFIFEHTTIQSIVSTDQQHRLVTATGKSFSAKKVIQATGPWLNKLLMNASQTPQNIRVKKIVAFHIMQIPKPDDPLFYFFDDDAFLLPEYEAGYWLFSFKCDHWDVLPNSSSLQIDEADKMKARNILKKYYPSFEPLCNAGRVFCDAYSDTGDPVIECLNNDGSYIFAGAGAGSGYRLAPAIAEKAINYFKDKA